MFILYNTGSVLSWVLTTGMFDLDPADSMYLTIDREAKKSSMADFVEFKPIEFINIKASC